MLKQLLDNDLVLYASSCATWQEAVRLSCQKFLEHGYIDARYVESIIACITQHGPYIIIAPDIALPHSTQGGDGVLKTGVSFLKLESPVSFDPTDSTKNARLFFTLAAVDADQHLENISNLMELLMNEDIVTALLESKNIESLKEIIRNFNL